MNTPRDPDVTIATWLDDGPNALPPITRQVVVSSIHLTPQRRKPLVRLPWRFPDMNTPHRVAAAAVIGVLLLGGAYYLFGGGGDPNVGGLVSPSPSPSPTPIPFPTGVGGGERVAAGTYAMELSTPSVTGQPVNLRVTFEMPDGWEKNSAPSVLWHRRDARTIGFRTVDNLYDDPCQSAENAGLLDPPLGPTIDDLVAGLSALPGVTVEGPTDTSLSGFSGKELTLTGKPELDDCLDGALKLWAGPQGAIGFGAGAFLGANESQRLVILDVGGARFLITMRTNQDNSTADHDELQAILDSVTIEVRDASGPSPSP